MIESLKNEFVRYKSLAEMALSQVKDEDLYRVLREDGNSIAILMAHLAGNFKSRFTNFLTEDGEKSWRNRDDEFKDRLESRTVLLDRWNEGWRILLGTVDSLSDSDLDTKVQIRGIGLTVSDALARSLAHVSFHVGQIVLLARTHVGADWKSLSIPRGESAKYALNPTKERQP